MAEQLCPRTNPPPVRFYASHRFWAMVTSISGGLTLAVPTVLSINPVAGLVCKLVGAALAIAGSAGQAWFGITSNRAVAWKKPESEVAGETQ